MSKEEKELCIKCNKETEVNINQHINTRLNYVVGAGQLCKACFKEVYELEVIARGY